MISLIKQEKLKSIYQNTTTRLINDKLEDIIDDQLDEKVKSVLSDMIRNRKS